MSEETNKRLPLILFSGGLDSTFLLFEALKKSDVDVVYVRHHNIREEKINKEKEASEQILELLQYDTRLRERYDIKYRVRRKLWAHGQFNNLGNYPGPGAIVMPQPVMWLSAILSSINLRDTSDVEMAYVQGDCAIARLNYIRDGWSNLLYACFDYDGLGGHWPDLRFPLVFMSKAEIIQRMPKKLTELTWSCELPIRVSDTEIKACGECVPCITRKVAEYHHSLKYKDVEAKTAADTEVSAA